MQSFCCAIFSLSLALANAANVVRIISSTSGCVVVRKTDPLKLRQLRRAKHGVVANEDRRIHFRITVLARMQVEHELCERALQPRERPFSTTKRAPDNLEAVSKSMRPSASPISKCSLVGSPSRAICRNVCGVFQHCSSRPRHRAHSRAACWEFRRAPYQGR